MSSTAFKTFPSYLLAALHTKRDGLLETIENFPLPLHQKDGQLLPDMKELGLPGNFILKLEADMEATTTATFARNTHTFRLKVLPDAPNCIGFEKDYTPDGHLRVTCLLPLSPTRYLNLASEIRDAEHSIRNEPLLETAMGKYYGTLMKHHHTLALVYTPNEPSYHHIYRSERELRHRVAFTRLPGIPTPQPKNANRR